MDSIWFLFSESMNNIPRRGKEVFVSFYFLFYLEARTDFDKMELYNK